MKTFLLLGLASFSMMAVAANYKINLENFTAKPTVVIKATLTPLPGAEAVTPEQVTSALGRILPKVRKHLTDSGIAPISPPFACWFKYEAKIVEFEAGLMVANPVPGSGEIVPSELASGRQATTIHVGPYQNIGGAYEALHSWLTEHSETKAGAPWEVYITDPMFTPPAKLRTKIYMPLK
jgi:AraC family transcriptional regulator